MVRAGVAQTAQQVPVIAGCGYGTAMARELAQAAEQAGADGILLLPPYLVGAEQAGLAAHVEAVCASTKLGVIMYNRDNAVLDDVTLAGLCDRCPNLVGFKDGVGDIERMTRIYARMGDRLTYIGGLPTAETFALPYLEMGVTTYSSAIFNFLPKFALDFYAAVRKRDHATVFAGLREFVLPYIQIRNRRKGYAVSIVKAGMKAVGRPAGPVRPPLTDLSESELQRFDQAHRGTVLTLASKTHVRYLIISILFAVSCFSYGDRVALSIAGTAMAKDISLDPVKMGYLFSGFSWAYVIGQLPSGALLDRFGSKLVYGIGIVVWSICALLTGFAGYLAAAAAFTVIFLLRLVAGFAQAPVFPGNGRIVASWFPANERGRASAIFNASQYFALMIFAPILGWIIHSAGWRSGFWFMGVLGFVFALIWVKNIYDVKDHPRISAAEIEVIEQGGGLVSARHGEGKSAHLGCDQAVAEPPHVGGYLPRPILHHHVDLVFPDLVSRISVPGAAPVDHEGWLCGGIACAMRRNRRNSRWGRFRPAVARRAFAQLFAQDADHRRHVAIGNHDRLQLCPGPGGDVALDVLILFRQRLRLFRLDGDLRHLTQRAWSA